MAKKSQTQLLSYYKSRRKRNRYNPKTNKGKLQEHNVRIFKIEYNEQEFQEYTFQDIKKILMPPKPSFTTWINIEGFQKKDIEIVGEYFKIHRLLTDDILSVGQRAKTDDMGNQIFTLLPMIAQNTEHNALEIEQISFIISNNLLISFQENTPQSDSFGTIKERIQNKNLSIKQLGSDYLAYSLLDIIVDNYFSALDPLADRLDEIESEVMNRPQKSLLLQLSLTRQELMVFKRNVMPVRELINNFLYTDNPLISENNKKYFKDILDHISLLIEYNENHREMIFSLQDLYMNQINARMNEVMKILTVVTTILAPITVISSIYGMNFTTIPFSNQPHGFLITIGIMLLISIMMILLFKKKGWF